jgi:hypothetical protein
MNKSYYNTIDKYSFRQYATGGDLEVCILINTTSKYNSITIRNTGTLDIYVNNIPIKANDSIVFNGNENEITDNKIVVCADLFMSNAQQFAVIRKKFI